MAAKKSSKRPAAQKRVAREVEPNVWDAYQRAEYMIARLQAYCDDVRTGRETTTSPEVIERMWLALHRHRDANVRVRMDAIQAVRAAVTSPSNSDDEQRAEVAGALFAMLHADQAERLDRAKVIAAIRAWRDGRYHWRALAELVRPWGAVSAAVVKREFLRWDSAKE